MAELPRGKIAALTGAACTLHPSSRVIDTAGAEDTLQAAFLMQLPNSGKTRASLAEQGLQ